MKKPQKLLSNKEGVALIAKNRREFRKRGATSQTLQCVETYFRLKDRNPRVAVADVARVLGVDASLVRRQMKRASEMRLVVKVGRTFFLFAKMVLQTAREAVSARVVARKYLQRKKKIGNRDKRMPHTKEIYLRERNAPEMASYTRAEALEALKRDYIPVHLRKAK